MELMPEMVPSQEEDDNKTELAENKAEFLADLDEMIKKAEERVSVAEGTDLGEKAKKLVGYLKNLKGELNWGNK